MTTAPSKSKAYFTKLARDLTGLLLGCYLFSLCARWHWIPDLFSHFAWQYAVGGLILAALLALFRSWKACALAALLCLVNVTELYRHADFSQATDGSAVTIALYNRNVGPTDQTTLRQWLTDNAQNFDVVVIQEASPSVQHMATGLGNLYPYQIQEARTHAFGTVVLSRHEFTGMEKINPTEQDFINLAFKFSIQPPQFEKPVTIYALHALPPMSGAYWRQRNNELAHVGRMAGYDPSPHRIMLGDWNVTAYSPFFADLLKDSRLTWKIGAPMPLPTWPTLGFPWLLQIKIDHILSSDTLGLASIERATPAHSDHYALIARFTEK